MADNGTAEQVWPEFDRALEAYKALQRDLAVLRKVRDDDERRGQLAPALTACVLSTLHLQEILTSALVAALAED